MVFFKRIPRLLAQVLARAPELDRAALAGELLAAKLRFLVVSALFVITGLAVLRNPSDPRWLWSCVSSGLTCVAATLLLRIARRVYRPFPLGVVSSTLDVTLVTLALLPSFAATPPNIYPWYLIAVAATGLRYDPRLCLVAGGVALVQLAVAFVALHDLTVGTFATYGLLIPFATTITTAIVLRARQLLMTSTRDPVTGLVNRRFFQERLKEALGGTSRRQHFAVALVGIDDLRSIKESQGQEDADQALRTVGEALQRCFRPTDTVARWGSDEFVILAAIEGRIIAERLAQTHTALAKPDLAIRISAGIAESSEVEFPSETLLTLADHRLYQANRSEEHPVVGPPARGAASTSF